MHYSTIKYSDIANGEGVRTTLFVSGCRRGCPGCFNPEAFSFTAGLEFTPQVQQELLASLRPGYVAGLTLLGGEPLEPENQEGLLSFLRTVRAEFPHKTIWCYTGFVYETLTGQVPSAEAKENRARIAITDEFLSYLDILVDGPYVEDLHDITLRFRGSSNQRIIDVPKTRTSGVVCLWEDDPLFATHVLS